MSSDEDKGNGQIRARNKHSPFYVARARALYVVERTLLIHYLSEHKGNVSHAAKAAGIQRHQLQRFMRKHKMRPIDFRTEARVKALRTALGV